MSMRPNKNALQQPFQIDPKSTDPVLQRRGKWVQPGPYDDEMQMREDYKDHYDGKWGKLVLSDSKLFDALDEKKSKEEYLQYLKLGHKLVDPNDPLSQQRAFQVVPELKSIPEEQFDEDVAFQEWIRILLRDGTILGAEDHKRMMTLMRPEVIIPTAPIWDLDGSFSTLASLKNIKIEDAIIKQVTGEVIFNPTPWAIDKKKLTGYLKELIPVKIALLKRVYPGCRAMAKEKAPDDADISDMPFLGMDSDPAIKSKLDAWYYDVFYIKKSVITNKATDNNYWKWWTGHTPAKDEDEEEEEEE